MTGLELKLKRIAARVKQWDLAEKIGVSPAKLSLIENERREASPALKACILAAIEEMSGQVFTTQIEQEQSDEE